jgi:hypothetical protein
MIADHLWDLFEQMARSMGSDRDALINQAMYMLARVNGFIEASRAGPAAGSRAASPDSRGGPGTPVLGSGAPRHGEISPPLEHGLGEAAPPAPGHGAIAAVPEHEAPSIPAVPPHGWAEQPPSSPRSARGDEDASHRQVAERVLQTAAELEQLIKSRSEARPPHAGIDAAEHMENGAGPSVELQTGLFIVGEDGHEGRVNKDRFLIGRGKHCDFVISSGKVSREHAVIVREGSEHFIEDLGSSNGTWFNKQRIKRRKIADGDEYFICSDKIRFALR